VKKLVALVVLVPALARGQSSPFLPAPTAELLSGALSGERPLSDRDRLGRFRRTPGSRDFFAAAEWLRGTAEEVGLEEARLSRVPSAGHAWSCAQGEAALLDPEEILASYALDKRAIAENSRAAQVTAEVVDVGGGLSEAEYLGREVKGKLVLASGDLAGVTREAVWKRGALGILWTRAAGGADPGTLPFEARGVEGVKDQAPGAFAVILSPEGGRRLRERLRSPRGGARVRVSVESTFGEPPEDGVVDALLRGGEIHDQQVVLSARLAEEGRADGGAAASVLEIGRVLAKLVHDGKLPRPRRDIRFLWTGPGLGEYLRQNPKDARKLLLDIHQQDLGRGPRTATLYASRLPWSVPNPLEDVLESVLQCVRDRNTPGPAGLLRTGGETIPLSGLPEPFPAAVVPYFAGYDHDALLRVPWAVPSTALVGVESPPRAEADGLDPTVLQRSALVAAAVALYYANLSDDDVGVLAAYAEARSRLRIQDTFSRAVSHLLEAPVPARDQAFKEARTLVHQETLRQTAKLQSLRRLAGKGRAVDAVAQVASRPEEFEGNEFSALERAFAALTGKNPPNLELGRDERLLSGKVYSPATPPGGAGRAEGPLNPALVLEIENLADGRRSALEIYEAALAAALAADGRYGTVTPKDVLDVLDRGVKAGAFTVKAK
jgi:hypothetical protein